MNIPLSSTATRTQNIFREIRYLAFARETGVLTVHTGEDSVRLCIVDGQLVFAHGGDSLPRYLVQSGVLSVSDYADVCTEVRAQGRSTSDNEFAAAAIRLGTLSPLDAFDAVSAAAELRVRRCLDARDARWSFARGELVHVARLALPHLLGNAVAGIHRARIAGAIERHADHYVFVDRPAAAVQAFDLDSAAREFVKLLDGTRTMRALADRPLGARPAAPLLAALVLSGDAELLQYPVPAPRFAAVRVRRVRDELAVDAKDVWRRGRELVRRVGSRTPAAESGARAYFLWLDFRSDPRPTWRKRCAVENAALAAVRANPLLGFGYYVLGELALRRGDEGTAEALFAHACGLDSRLRRVLRWQRGSARTATAVARSAA
jgi:hypothetical protein